MKSITHLKLYPSKWPLILYSIAVLVAIAVSDPGLFGPARNTLSAFSITPAPLGNFRPNLKDSAAQSQFREGEKRTGASEARISPPLEIGWASELLNVGIHSASKATPAVDSSELFVGDDAAWFHSFTLSGNSNWRFYSGPSDRGIHGTAATDGHRAYFGDYRGWLTALEKASGKIAWTIHLGAALGASPLIFQDSIFVNVETSSPPNGFLVRLQKSDGKTIWKSAPLGEQSHSSPALEFVSQKLYVGANNGVFYGLNASNGSVAWTFQAQGPIKSTPCVADGKVFFTAWSGNLYALDGQTGVLRWSTGLEGRAQSSPSYSEKDQMLVVSAENQGVFGVDALTGKIKWRYPVSNAHLKGSALLTQSQDGQSTIAWIACGEHQLCAFQVRSGKLLSRIELPAELSGAPATDGRSLYVALDDPGGLVRLDPKLHHFAVAADELTSRFK